MPKCTYALRLVPLIFSIFEKVLDLRMYLHIIILIFYVVEGLFNSYISLQDYKPRWTAIEPASPGKLVCFVRLYITSYFC